MGPPPSKHCILQCVWNNVFSNGNVENTLFLRVLAIIPVRWNVKRDVRASIGAYGGGNGAYGCVSPRMQCFPLFQKHCKIQCLGRGGGKHPKGGYALEPHPAIFRRRVWRLAGNIMDLQKHPRCETCIKYLHLPTFLRKRIPYEFCWVRFPGLYAPQNTAEKLRGGSKA